MVRSAGISIRSRLLIHFAVFALLCWAGIVMLGWYTHHERQRAVRTLARLQVLSEAIHTDLARTKDHLLIDIQRVDYHRTGTSATLQAEQFMQNLIQREFVSIDALDDELIADQAALDTVRGLFSRHNAIFRKISEVLRLRGMEDHGVEGRMRRFAHALESNGRIAAADVLGLRRYEKDYIIRHQTKYAERLRVRVHALQEQLMDQRVSGARNDVEVADLLQDYLTRFDSIVQIDDALGLWDRSGMSAELDEVEARLLTALRTLMDSQALLSARTERTLVRTYILAAFVILALCMLFAVILSARIARPINALALAVNAYIARGFRDKRLNGLPRPRERELQELGGHFSRLVEEIAGHWGTLTAKVEERTSELRAAKDEAETRTRELDASLRYARTLQDSMLGMRSDLEALFPDHLVVNLPRDIVSGDFLWSRTIEHGDRRSIYFAVADCTGHGVPGCLLSVMCHRALNDVFDLLVDPSPAEVLTMLNTQLREKLIIDRGTMQGDGMSIALCRYDEHDRTLLFAGAHQSLYMLAAGASERIRGDRGYIGNVGPVRSERVFSDHRRTLGEETVLFLASDGLCDQFGGRAGRKLGAKGMEQMFKRIVELPLGQRQRALHEEFMAWKGGHDQVDDVMVLGIRMCRSNAGVARASKAA